MYDELSDSEYVKRLEAIFNNAPGGLFTYDLLTGEFIFISHILLDYLHYSEDEFRARFKNHFSEMVYSLDRDIVLKSIKEQDLISEYVTSEFRIQRKDGTIVWVHSRSHHFNKEGKHYAFVILIDVTHEMSLRNDLILKNRELEASNQTLQKETDYIPGGIRIFRRTLNDKIICISANQYFADMIGVKKEDLIGETFEKISLRVHPDDVARHREETVVNLDKFGSITGTYRFFNARTNCYRWYQLNAKLVVQADGTRLAYFHYTDIDDLKMVEDIEKTTREQYQLAVRSASLTVWEYNVKTKTFYLSDEASTHAPERYGITKNVILNVPESLVESGLFDRSKKEFIQFFEDIKEGKEYPTAEVWFQKQGGIPCCDRISCYVVKDKDGMPSFAYGVGIDITASKQEAMQFHDTIQSILVANPESLCTFRINLTKNLCFEGHGVSQYIFNSLQSNTASGLFSNCLKMIPLVKDQEYFNEIFNLDHLLAMFQDGITNAHRDYRRYDEFHHLFWVRTFVNLLRNPDTKDIEGLIYSLDISHEMRQNAIMRIIMGGEYDIIALLHVDTSEVEILKVDESTPAVYHTIFKDTKELIPSEVLRQKARQYWIDKEDGDRYFEATKTNNIVSALNQYGKYEITVKGHSENGKTIYRQIQHYYLDELKDSILIIESDVTQIYESQKRELDKAKAEANKVRDILDSIASGITVLHMPDPDHLSYQYVNQQMFRLLHFKSFSNAISFDKSINDPVILAYLEDGFVGVHPDDITRVKKTFHDNFYSEAFSVEDYRTMGGDNEYHWIRQDVRLREVNSEYRTFYSVYQDVSEEVRLRLEREEQLEEEKKLRLEATAANEAKSDFLSRMSHDIRTPLNGIIGMTYLASENDNPQGTKEALKKIDTSSKFLLGLINDILDMSKAESGKMEIRPELYFSSDFEAYLQAVIVPLVEEKNQTLNTDLNLNSEYVPYMDPLRTNQIIFNLLSNAVKYTKEGGTITLKIDETLTNDKKLHLDVVVSDNGIGMSDEFQKHLFEPFSQEGRNDVSLLRGSGLGLSIVKKIVDLMHGTIEVDSKLDIGTTFHMTADFEAAPISVISQDKPLLKKTSDDFSSLKGKHVLLCEDHPLNQEIAVALLKEKGMTVDVADNGSLGLSLFKKSPLNFYDIILMDIRMPIMDGYTATKKIRMLSRLDAKKVPIIAMTADAFDDDIQKAKEAGMNDHLSRPIEPKTLYQSLLNMLE